MNCFAVEIDESFPRYIQENKPKYDDLIFPVTNEYIKRVRLPRLFRTIQGRLIQFCEFAMPSFVHDMLHVVRMALLLRGKRHCI